MDKISIPMCPLFGGSTDVIYMVMMHSILALLCSEVFGLSVGVAASVSPGSPLPSLAGSGAAEPVFSALPSPTSLHHYWNSTEPITRETSREQQELKLIQRSRAENELYSGTSDKEPSEIGTTSTRDKTIGPKVSLVRRFHCIRECGSKTAKNEDRTFSFDISSVSFLFSCVCWLLRSEVVLWSCSTEVFSVASPFVNLCTFSVILDSCGVDPKIS